ncbi:MAG: glycosyltransferase family protein [Cellvibrionaceae bacterium]
MMLLTRWTFANIVDGASSIFVVTMSMEKYFRRLGFNTVFAPNGASSSMLELYSRKTISGPVRIVLSGNLGAAQDESAIKLLIEEMRGFPKRELHLVGSSSQFSTRASTNVFFHGTLSQADYACLLNSCHIGVSLRNNDFVGRNALPVRLFDYLSLGLPAVVYPRGEVEKLFGCTSSIKFLETETDSVNEAISTMISDLPYEVLSSDANRMAEKHSRKATSQLIVKWAKQERFL